MYKFSYLKLLITYCIAIWHQLGNILDSQMLQIHFNYNATDFLFPTELINMMLSI